MQTTPLTPHVRSRQGAPDVDELAEHMGSVHIAQQPSKRGLQHGATPASQARPRTLRRTAQQVDGKENTEPHCANAAAKYTPSRLACFAELKDELSCSICLDICVRPCTTQCGHTFCRRCLRQALRHSLKCPKCRGSLPVGTELKVNTSLWNTIQLLFPAHAADAPPVTPAEPKQQAGPRRAAAARAASRQLPVLLLPTRQGGGAQAPVPGQTRRAPALRAPRQARARAPVMVDPDIDLSDSPDAALFDEFVVSPLSPPIAPHIPRAAPAPARRSRGQALVAALQEIESGLAVPRELGEALELQQMFDANRQGQQGARSSHGRTSQPAARATAAAAAGTTGNPFRRNRVQTQPPGRASRRQESQQQLLQLESSSEWDSDLDFESDANLAPMLGSQRHEAAQPGERGRRPAGRATTVAAAAPTGNPFARTAPSVPTAQAAATATAAAAGEGQRVDALWRSLGMLDTPPCATAVDGMEDIGLFGRLHSGNTPQAGAWRQQAAAAAAGAERAAEAETDSTGLESDGDAEQLRVLLNPWRSTSERLEDALGAAAAALAAAPAAPAAARPHSPASVASEDAQQLTLPLSPEPLLARIRQDSEGTAALHSGGTASGGGSLPAFSHQRVTASLPALNGAQQQPPVGMSLLRQETLAAAAAVSGAGRRVGAAAGESGEDDFQPSQRSRRSAAAVRAAAHAAGSAGGGEQGRRQRVVSGLRRGAAPSRRGV